MDKKKLSKRKFVFSKIVNGRIVSVIEVVGKEPQECTIEQFEEAVDRVIKSGNREQIWLLKDHVMQALYYGKHTYPEKMESNRKCLRKLERALKELSA